ncbi:MAG: ABC-2 family transporter protein [Clostridia bacterium]|nr:ABC-2 family transporter protein [Clostridia bacterium]
MGRFFSIYLAFFKQQVKSLMEYKIDFMLGMIGLSIQQVANFLLIFVAFTQIKAMGAYSFNEILLFYGYSQIIRGIDHVYNDNIWAVANAKIKDGEFALYQIRPINTIIHIVIEKVQFDGIGEFLLGVVIFTYAKVQLNLVFGIKEWAVFFVFIITGLAIYFAIKLACASVAFWTVTSRELMTVAYEINGFTKYPLDIYKNHLIKLMITYVLPFAVVSYVPMVYFIRDHEIVSQVIGIPYPNREFLILFAMLIAVISLSLSIVLWNRGLKKYEPTGI